MSDAATTPFTGPVPEYPNYPVEVPGSATSTSITATITEKDMPILTPEELEKYGCQPKRFAYKIEYGTPWTWSSWEVADDNFRGSRFTIANLTPNTAYVVRISQRYEEAPNEAASFSSWSARSYKMYTKPAQAVVTVVAADDGEVAGVGGGAGGGAGASADDDGSSAGRRSGTRSRGSSAGFSQAELFERIQASASRRGHKDSE